MLKFKTKQLVKVCSFFEVMIQAMTRALPRTHMTEVNPKQTIKIERDALQSLAVVASLLQFEVVMFHKSSDTVLFDCQISSDT